MLKTQVLLASLARDVGAHYLVTFDVIVVMFDVPAAFPLRLNEWRHKRGIFDYTDGLVMSYERRYVYGDPVRAS